MPPGVSPAKVAPSTSAGDGGGIEGSNPGGRGLDGAQGAGGGGGAGG